jgi:hypothetical protein
MSLEALINSFFADWVAGQVGTTDTVIKSKGLRIIETCAMTAVGTGM